jgi:hypothetical protein
MLLFINIPLVGVFTRILRLPNWLLVPGILAISAVGVYSVHATTFDLLLMAGCGIVGYLLRKQGVPMAPLILGFVLGDMMEQNLRRALSITNGEVSILLESPISIGLWVAAGAMLVVPPPRCGAAGAPRRRARPPGADPARAGSVQGREELPELGRGGLAEELFGRPHLVHAALVHEDHPVADLAGKAHLVGDHHQGHAVAGQALHHLQHLAHQLRVQRRGDLVAQQDVRVHGQRAGDGHRCCWPPESWLGRWSNLSARPTRCSSWRARASSSAAGSFFTRPGASITLRPALRWGTG